MKGDWWQQDKGIIWGDDGAIVLVSTEHCNNNNISDAIASTPSPSVVLRQNVTLLPDKIFMLFKCINVSTFYGAGSIWEQ